MSKPKKCRVCGYNFVQRSSTHVVCDLECAKILAIAVRKKAELKLKQVQAKADKAQREKLKTRAQWQKEAQAAVNLYVRQRDAALPCISCGRHHAGQYHAGHYLSRGAHPALALDPRNIYKQCAPCNTHLSGNQVEFRKALVRLHGIDLVDWLEGPHDARKYSVEALAAIKREYLAKARDLMASQLTFEMTDGDECNV